VLKPDIAAPGQSITSALTGTVWTGGNCGPCPVAFNPNGPSAPLTISGTSMAAPHVAGMMALLRQQRPDWTVEELKALAMNTALNDIHIGAEGSGPRFGAGRVGAGRVDVPRALQAEVIAFDDEANGQVSVSFDIEAVVEHTEIRRVRVVNHGNSPQTFDLGFDVALAAPGVSLSLPDGPSITVPAQGSAVFQVRLDATANLMQHVPDPTILATQVAGGPLNVLGALPRHRLGEHAAHLEFRQAGELGLRLPVYAAIRPAAQLSGGTIATGGDGTGSGVIPLSGLDFDVPGTLPVGRAPLVSAYELQAIRPRNPALPPSFNIRHAGVSANAATSTLRFGVSSWADWSSPNLTVFNIAVDLNADDEAEHFVIAASTGQVSAFFFGTQGQPSNDVYLSYRLTAEGSLGVSSFINVSPAAVESALFASNVVGIPVAASLLGVDSATPFRYRVMTCPFFSPDCGSFGSPIDSTGWLSWDPGARGLDFPSQIVFAGDGDALDVNWNTANLVANQSLGALLLHHHNSAGSRAQVVLLEGAAAADLAITKIMAPPDAEAGDEVTFTVTVTNSGPDSASSIVVEDLLPQGLEYISDNSVGAYNPGNGIWSVPGTLGLGESASLSMTALLAASGPITNTARIVGSSLPDPNPFNDQASATANAASFADLALEVSATPEAVTSGDTLAFRITIANLGEDTSFSLEIEHEITAAVAIVPDTVVPSAGAYNPATRVWSLASLGKGASATLDIELTAPDVPGTITLQTSAQSAVSDPDSSNDSAQVSVSVLLPDPIFKDGFEAAAGP
jgi:uncharacterized repeat protein (TIGR01451 family)